MKVYFAANNIDSGKHTPVLLSVIGSRTFSLLLNLCALGKPAEKSFDDLCKLLKDHFCPKPIVIAEQFYFHTRNQRATESIADYMAELCRLAALRLRKTVERSAERRSRLWAAQQHSSEETADGDVIDARQGVEHSARLRSSRQGSSAIERHGKRASVQMREETRKEGYTRDAGIERELEEPTTMLQMWRNKPPT